MAQQEPARRGDGRGARAEPDAGPDDHAGSRPDLLGRIAGPLAAINRAPLTSYHVVMVVTALLTVIGLGMVLSSSNVLAFSGGGTPFDIFLRQAVFVAIGWVGFVVALRMRFEVLRAAALPMLLVSIGLLIAVLIPGVGMEINGSRSWIDLGFFGIQPAEIAKLAFIVWASSVVAKRIRTGYWLDLLFPAIVGYGVVAALVVVAPDLGMATAVTIAFLCVLWFSGYPTRHFVWVIAFGTVVFGVLAVTFAYRFERIRTFFNTFVGDFSNPQGSAYQSYQGMLSLADGGLFGVGLGQSSAKWFYLPEATNDFIFAIIGEELGWFGAAVVVSLYLTLGWAGMRIALRSADPFRRLLAGTISTTIVLQAFINIGYVVGLLPVTGLQLPLISNGGTSAIVTLTSLGLLANCARHEPEAISAILSSPERRRRRWTTLPDPRPYTPERPVPASGTPGRSSAGARRYGDPVTRQPAQRPPAARPSTPPRSGQQGRGRSAPVRGAAQPAPVPRPARGTPGAPAYESMPIPADAARDRRRGATAMTGRNARPVRGREADRRQPRRPASEPGSRQTPGAGKPSPIHRGRER
ncbi:putative lipid II flippase FtsW [Dietzia sp. PP-33]|jgi:cell division protein FtsW|uniref:putative lipid II flippase FtsW n=1 Tax=Dietzia sp. PP-33 TaxID=2957500 RepID=UPI0029B891ED|nr:putative lipid II flippase FtsW [Dietzia sp. PP-33]MDX2357371.1 putative lipid II flippase FtsW [Dietzia sp. PP-33]